MKERDSFIFYRSFYESILELPEDNQKDLLLAIANYSLNFKEPELKGLSKAVWILIKPQLDANNKRYENGTKGGRPKTKKKPNNNQNKTKSEPNKNVNVNKNENILEINSEWRNNFLKHYTINLDEYLKKLSAFSLAYDMDRPEKELKQHFFNWFKTQDYKKHIVPVPHWNENRNK